MDEALENLTQSAAPSPSPTNEGWFAYLPEGGERMELKFSEEIETQFALVEANQGNRHMRYDLVTLCLRAIRVPLTEDFARTSVLLELCVCPVSSPLMGQIVLRLDSPILLLTCYCSLGALKVLPT